MYDYTTVKDSKTETDDRPILQNENAEGEWVPICKPEEVPKGARPNIILASPAASLADPC